MSQNKPTILVRPYAETDQEFVLQGMADLAEIEAGLHDGRRPTDRILNLEYLREALSEAKEKSGGFLVAEKYGLLAGFLGYWVESDGVAYEALDAKTYGYISDIWVDPSFRKSGVARTLLNSASGKLRKDTSVARLRVTALSDNHRALDAYRSFGFSSFETTLELKIS